MYVSYKYSNLGNDNVKRIKWPLGIVFDLFPGKERNFRVAKVKTFSGESYGPCSVCILWK